MVTVKFFNLIRSRYKVTEVNVKPGTIHSVIEQILSIYPHIPKTELEQAVLFVNREKVMHLKRFYETVQSGDEIVFTHFVGGG